MRMKQFRLIGAALLSLSLSGCAGLLVGGTAVGVSVAHDRRTTGTMVDDQTIEFKLYDALNKKLPPGNQISITSYNGTVLLAGQTVSDATRWQAEDIARNLREPPVRMVHNELIIGSPVPLSVQSNDALLTTKVKTALFQINHIPGFDPTRVKVVTNQSVVYLMGLVRTNEADAAADVASQISGVRQVVTLFELID
ncbi:MAG: BON domain-containing protein [Candidatus Competibacteraceae bacterium]|nr:BON domain-containing protein [Candidatus Competibacteraceae bacterium]MCB1822157.1 BON domain-containing protein [Candidatus Competibacteraceae bacterium]